MPKDTIKEEFIKWGKERPLMKEVRWEEIADWWIQKMESHDAELRERIDSLKPSYPYGLKPDAHYEKIYAIGYNAAKGEVKSSLSPSSDNTKENE